jgi:biotin transport system substrate-specific component
MIGLSTPSLSTGGTVQSSPALTLADAIVPRIESDNRALAIARDIALMVAFAAFVAMSAQIQVRLPWTTVPITGQTFAVLVTGAALGAWRGAGSLIIYAIAGMFLLPVFTPAVPPTSGAWDVHFVLPWVGNERALWELSSGGYVVGFILTAALVGWLAERGWDRKQWVHVAMLLGNVILYVPGLLWLGYLIATDWVAPGGSRALSEVIPGSSTLEKTLNGGLYPFIVGDLMKLLLASMVLPSAWLLVDKLRPHRETDRGGPV